MASVTLNEMSKDYGEVQAVDRLSLRIEDGEFVTLLGPSGCGKSTTLTCVAGLDEPSSGTILFDATVVNELSPKERDVAMVFQDYALYPHMSVFENMAFALRLQKTPADTVDRIVRQVADFLGLGALLDRRPANLSGGQRQRVALGRAIVRNPVVFLMDEPLSNLDAALRVSTRTEIKRLQRELGTTTIFVTHDQEEAMVLSDRVAILDSGRLQQYDTPQRIYRDPANLFVAGFIGSPRMNFIPGTITRAESRLLFVPDDGGFNWPLPPLRDEPAGTAVMLGVRPEHLHVTRGAAGEPVGTVVLVEPVGSVTFVNVTVGGWSLRASVAPDEEFVVDESITVSPQPDKIFLFAPESGERIRTG
ncbi:MAG: ABC transporter ATP-binding protein [Chloroflexia bacterium]|nr:ABC transporter ATP-binding protein [Chloroflexia bacterium]